MDSNTYGHESGGLPCDIPNLTWEALRAFHKKHYSVNNAKFFTYGRQPLEQNLEAIQDYLPKKGASYEKVDPVPNEPRWSEPRSVHIHCAPDPTQTERPATLAMTYLMTDINDSYENFTLRILSELLTDGASSPFYKALIESGLGTNYVSGSGKFPFPQQKNKSLHIYFCSFFSFSNDSIVICAIFCKKKVCNFL